MFTHLHVHSHYSLLDATSKIESLLDACKARGMGALALTDHGNLFGAIEFYTKARQAGVKPLVGCEVYVAPGSRKDREANADGETYSHLVLLARDLKGWKNLIKLVSASYLEGFYYRPRIDREILSRHAEGLTGLAACLKGDVARNVLLGRDEEAEHAARELDEILGRGNFYLEVQNHGLAEQQKVNEWVFAFGKRAKFPVVATNDVHYIDREDALVHDVLLCIGTGKMLKDERRKRYSGDQFYFKGPEEMAQAFPGNPEALERTAEAADRCSLVLPVGEVHFPRFDSGHPEGNPAFLRELCEKGMERRYGERAGTKELKARLNHELEVIGKQGFVNYFLIVWDFVRFSKDKGIPVGPGRGSAAGSVVSYALGITELDPLKYDLLFERFLNPGRNDPPDIDIDFCENRRGEVIRYVRDRYGEENVCQIITFGRMLARAAVRDVGRVLDVPLPDVDSLAKKIPAGVTLADALEQETELVDRCNADPNARRIVDIARKLEGLCRHASVHAAGVVISDKPLSEYVPLYSSKGDVTTQFSMNDLGAIGLLKMDFLGLKNLTIIAKTLENIRTVRGETVDLQKIPLDDPEAYALLSRGDTTGIFQLESSGMRDLLQKMKPDRFEDLIATIAIYRPGPLRSGMADSFVEVKHGRKKAEYLHPDLQPILEETHGMILYQEQAMRIANRFGGLSLTDADHLRKAMSKKKEELMAKFREKFVSGAVAGGKSREIAEKVFEQINHFAGYGFNKSHSAAYAVLSLQTAWLKAHYLVEYQAALLTCRGDKIEDIVKHVEDCRRSGIDILRPDVNESAADFAVVAGGIRFGLSAVKNVGDKAVEAIVAARSAKGPFASLFDFCRRVDLQAANKKVLETLVQAGAFDSLGPSRAALAAGLEHAMQAGAGVQSDRAAGQMTFFDTFQDDRGFRDEALPALPEWSEIEKLAREKEVLGFYLTSHPLARHEKEIRCFSDAAVQEILSSPVDGAIVAGGMIAGLKERRVKNGKNAGRKFAAFHLEDLTGVVEAVAFPDVYDRLKNLIAEDRVVFLKARVERREGTVSLYVDDLVPLEMARTALAERLVLTLGPAGVPDETLQGIRRLLQTHRGSCQVFIEFFDPSGRRIVLRAGDEFRVAPSEALDKALDALLGQGHVRWSRSKNEHRIPETPAPARAPEPDPLPAESPE